MRDEALKRKKKNCLLKQRERDLSAKEWLSLFWFLLLLFYGDSLPFAGTVCNVYLHRDLTRYS